MSNSIVKQENKSIIKKQKKFSNHYKNIENTLDGFLKNNKIPNILFYGEHGSGKKTILNNFLNKIYKNVSLSLKKNYIMYINCVHGKGIKFIRDDLKFFARSNINTNKDNSIFKSIILLNADKLTIDAQSALRRCIELFSKNTRFFIVIENKQKLLKPILSRFCEIYIGNPIVKNKSVNLYNLQKNKVNKSFQTKKNNMIKDYLKELEENKETFQYKINDIINIMYNKGISGIDLIDYLKISLEENEKKYLLLIHFSKIKIEYRNEKLLMLHILNIYIMRNDIDLENICKM